MTDRPEDIPQWAWDEAERALVDAYVDHHKDFNPMSNSISVGLWDKFTETFARANLQARSQAFEEAIKIVDGYGDTMAMAGENGEMLPIAPFISQAIRQHSKKGRDNEQPVV